MANYKDTLYLVDKVSRPLEMMSRKLGVFEKRAEKARKRIEHLAKMGDKLKSFGTKLTVGLTLPILALGTASLKAAADFEKMQQQLSIILGSAEKGKKWDKLIDYLFYFIIAALLGYIIHRMGIK